MKIVILGLTLRSTAGNRDTANFRALCAELTRRGHWVTFCERDFRRFAEQQDADEPMNAELILYRSLDDLAAQARQRIRAADLVILSSRVLETAALADWLLGQAQGIIAFYDTATPATLANLSDPRGAHLRSDQLGRFDLYLSSAGGPVLEQLRELGARHPVAFHDLVDPTRYRPATRSVPLWDVGFLGTLAGERQSGLERLLLPAARAQPDRRFVVASPEDAQLLGWPRNIERVHHIPTVARPWFYSSHRYALHLNNASLRTHGWAPSAEMLEAAACGTPVITEPWPGLEEFFTPVDEVLIAYSAGDISAFLTELSDRQRETIADRARRRVLREHTAARRVDQLQAALTEASGQMLVC